MVVVVTGYVPIPGHPRPREEYDRYGKQLLECDFPIVFAQGDLSTCWLARYLAVRHGECTHSVADNPEKNTLAYLIVQAEKTTWLAEAALNVPNASVLVWIDFGIFRLPDVTKEIVQKFVLQARNERAIVIPGCWDKQAAHDDAYPNWRFCGGVMVVPCEHAVALDHAMKREYIRRLLDTNHVTWEVNVLAAVEQLHPELPIWWYKANHNCTLFENYRKTEHADIK
jgi:hypothetical protein